MILGISVNCFQGLSLAECIDLLLDMNKKVRFEALELRLEESSRNPSVWFNSMSPALSVLLNSFKIVGAHLPLDRINLISNNIGRRNESLSKITRGLEIAEALNVDYCVMHARGSKAFIPSGNVENDWKDVISTLTQFAEDRSLLLLVENADSITNLQTLVRIVKSIDSKSLKVTLDVGHAHIREIFVSTGLVEGMKDFTLKGRDFLMGDLYRSNKNMPYEAYGSISNFLSRENQLIKNIHIHDYNGRKDHLPLGSGSIDFSFLSMLGQTYRGPCIIETFSAKPYSELIQSYSTLIGCC